MRSNRSISSARFHNFASKLCSNRLVQRIFCSAQMSPRLIRKYCVIDSVSKALLENAITRLGLSARAYDRILTVSRTLADLEGSESNVSEAIQYRTLNRNSWP